MPRLILEKNARKQFFKELTKKSGFSLDTLADHCNISGRTLRDWRRGKFLPSLKILDRLAKKYKIKYFPTKTLPDDWYISSSNARKAAFARIKLYGPPGTAEGRIKGGSISQKNRKENPEKYRKLGCVIRKKFPKLKPSVRLAELFGIILGDGSITNNQIRISLGRRKDTKYSKFVSELMESQFGEKPGKFMRESTIELHTSGVELIQLVEKMGLKRGDKIYNQVEIPQWIKINKQFARVCVRGLFDTDGGLFIHKHRRGKQKWSNLGWCYTSYSLPLMESVRLILIENDINPKGNNKRIFLYSVSEIRKFMKVIGSSNPKNLVKFEYYLKNFYNYEWKNRKGGRVA